MWILDSFRVAAFVRNTNTHEHVILSIHFSLIMGRDLQA